MAMKYLNKENEENVKGLFIPNTIFTKYVIFRDF